jgi:hypothetical protein
MPTIGLKTFSLSAEETIFFAGESDILNVSIAAVA